MKTFIKITFFLTMFLTSSLLQAQYTAGGNNSANVGNGTFVGAYAGQKNTSTGYYNSFFGREAGRYNTTGDYNTFSGFRSGRANTSGRYNTFTGYQAGYSNTTSTANSFFGVSSGQLNTTGSQNTLMGFQAGFFNKSGVGNTFVGYRAGLDVIGSKNVMIGYKAGEDEKGSNQLYIANSNTSTPLIKGDFSTKILTINGTLSQLVNGNIGGFNYNDKWSSLGDSPANDIYGMLNQGYGATFVSGSKSGAQNIIGFSGSFLDFDVIGAGGPTTTLMSLSNGGNLNVTGTATAAGVLLNSDKRYKENIKVIENAMDKIKALDGFTYDFKDKKINGRNLKAITGKKQIGFVAQNVQEVFPELVEADENSYLAVNYVAIIPVLVEAMKEQQEVIDEQEEGMIKYQEEITDLRTRLEKLEALLNNTEDIQGSITPANENTDMSGVVLRQNAPNPLRDRTTIEYQLPDNLKTALLTVFDLNGKSITTYNITGKGSIEFDASGLPNGTYAYAIVANGRSIASQKMVIQR